MITVSVIAADNGWAVRSPALENQMVFLSGARAERAARRLAHALACRGECVELQIYARSDQLVGRFLCPPPAPPFQPLEPGGDAWRPGQHQPSGQSGA